MPYPETVRYLISLGNEVKSAKLGLERIETLLDALGRPQDAFQSVHIAGTNGKGSTAAMVEAGLRAAGFRTGLYTSPHLVRINERIQVSGAEISDPDFCGVFETVRASVEKLLAQGAFDLHPTYFEFVTAMAFCHFRNCRVQYAAIEVGLGGRLDATNVIRPQAAVITPVDFDHEALLGKAAASISAEKAGILKQGVPAVFAPQHPEAKEVLEARARELGIRVVHAGRDWRAANIRQQDGRYRFHALDNGGRRLTADLGLAGEHQITNALAAVATLDLLGVPDEAIERGLREARWPGRLEQVAENPMVLLDGAHNPAGARALARHVRRHFPGRRVWLIYAAMRDKAVEEVAGILFPLAHKVFLARLSQARALHPETLRDIAGHHHACIEIAGTFAEALSAARAAASPADIILVTGSLFLAGEAKALCSAPFSGPIR
jgi:dihydrofolate synthase/folylpolyglutamate synthase